MQNIICIHCHVSGLVQGVWYRATTQEEAKKLGLKGWVKNLSDGRVEVLVCGEKDKVMQLYKWLHKGPPRAKVSDVTYVEKEPMELDDFRVI